MDEMNFRNAAIQASNDLAFEVLAELQARTRLKTIWALESSSMADFLESQAGALVSLSCAGDHAFNGTLVGANENLCLLTCGDSAPLVVGVAHIINIQVRSEANSKGAARETAPLPVDLGVVLAGTTGQQVTVWTTATREPQRATTIGVGEDYALFSTHPGDPFAQRISSIIAIGLTLPVSS